MRVAWFPKTSDLYGNPYWSLLQYELEQLGVEFENSHSGFWMRRHWLWDQRRHVSVLHFHFIQPHYALDARYVSLRRLVKFTNNLILARLLGYKIVWTMHDLMPAWPKEPRWIDMAARQMISRLADEIIVHCEVAQNLARTQFGRRRSVHVIPHASFVSVYPNEIEQADARRLLQVPTSSFLFVYLGGIRPNKGIETLIAAFNQLEGDGHLVIAGNPDPPEAYWSQIERLTANNSRITLHMCRIPDDKLQVYLNAADSMVFPFREILTSSSVMLALSFGRPVIAPAIGCLGELIGEDAGFLYPAQQADGLVCAMKTAMESNLAMRRKHILQRIGRLTWRTMAAKTLAVYER